MDISKRTEDLEIFEEEEKPVVGDQELSMPLIERTLEKLLLIRVISNTWRRSVKSGRAER